MTNQTQTNSNKVTQTARVFVFFGPDDFSLRRKIDTWKREYAKKYSADSIAHVDRGELNEKDLVTQLDQALSPSLFSSRKLVIAKDILPSKAAEDGLGEYLLGKVSNLPADYFVILWQSNRPDKRLGMIKKILTHPNVAVTEFDLPHGIMLNAWIKAYAKTLSLDLDDSAIEELAKYLGRDFFEEKKAGGKVIERKEMFDLWQAHSELQKLASFSPKADISAVRALVKPRVPENVFALTDELARKNRTAALNILEQLLNQPAADDKSATIKIISLLAEQSRSMLTAKLLDREGQSHQEIADALGWSSGRVFITLKNATGHTVDRLKQMIGLLTDIDAKLKTSEDSPKMLINQFIFMVCG